MRMNEFSQTLVPCHGLIFGFALAVTSSAIGPGNLLTLILGCDKTRDCCLLIFENKFRGIHHGPNEIFHNDLPIVVVVLFKDREAGCQFLFGRVAGVQ